MSVRGGFTVNHDYVYLPMRYSPTTLKIVISHNMGILNLSSVSDRDLFGVLWPVWGALGDSEGKSFGKDII